MTDPTPPHYRMPEQGYTPAPQYQTPPPQQYPAQQQHYPAPQQRADLQPYAPAPQPTAYHQSAPAANVRLVSAGGRLGAVLLDGLLIMVTLGIGWIIWTLITWSDGQTPAKRLLGHVVADAQTGRPFDWGRMALRELGIKGLLGWVLDICTLSVYFWIDSLMVLGEGQRTLHDRMAGSVVRYV